MRIRCGARGGRGRRNDEQEKGARVRGSREEHARRPGSGVMSILLSTTKVGVQVKCAVCGHMKKPRGRSGPLGAYYCEPRGPTESYLFGCDGYYKPPFVGSLWPGESEADFGYPCMDDGTTKEAAK